MFRLLGFYVLYKHDRDAACIAAERACSAAAPFAAARPQLYRPPIDRLITAGASTPYKRWGKCTMKK